MLIYIKSLNLHTMQKKHNLLLLPPPPAFEHKFPPICFNRCYVNVLWDKKYFSNQHMSNPPPLIPQSRIPQYWVLFIT